jgi:hypothetical protein
MFELLMKYASDKETMQKVLDAFEIYINERIDIYEELSDEFPASRRIFEQHTTKAYNIIKRFPLIIKEYF